MQEIDKGQANALLLEILFSQQVNSALVRRNVNELTRRINGLSAAQVFMYSDDEFVALFSRKPAIHRFVNRMSHQTRQLFTILNEEYGDDARNIWLPVVSAGTLMARLQSFPGIGPHKARVGLFLLTREFDVTVLGDGGDYAIEGCAKLPGKFNGNNTPLLQDSDV